ncbi:MAG: stage 0 sporulation family protein [Firmicutes bacterium]|nr:stage 0 sporulation family protein [Bacillota bacterium]
MPTVIGVKFKRTPKMYYFEAGTLQYKINCGVIVETARGVEYGTVGMLPREIPESKIVAPLKPVLKIATDDDKIKAEEMEQKRPDAMRLAAEIIAKNGLEMNLVDAQYTFDGAKLILYFIAENRVDFRELVRELATAFRARIELKQIGARDECKLKGGLGPCGRACCCSDYINDFAHVTIKMAKNQNLSLNPGKISGLCGRLMCCLSYENAYYAEVNKRMPKLGSEVKTKDGRTGTVLSVCQLKETVTLRVSEGDNYGFAVYGLADLLFKGKVEAIAEEDEPVTEELKSLED